MMSRLMRNLLLPILSLTLVTGHRLQVSGYSSLLATFTISGDQLVPQGQKELGSLKDMTWLQTQGDFLYGAHEVGDMEGQPGGAVSRWKMGEGAEMELKEWVTVGSGYPAHVLVVPQQGMVYTANYGGSSFSGLALDAGGQLGEVVYLENFPGAGETCRDASHPHQTVSQGQWVWLVDLGCDRIRHYRHTQAGLQREQVTNLEAGSGPRHMSLHPRLPLAFVLCELQSKLLVYSVDQDTSGLGLLQEVTLASTDGDYGAEILVQGDFVYASSRGSGVLLVYRIQEAGGRLQRLQQVKLEGSWPRSLAIRGELGAVIDQKGDSVQLLHVDTQTGLVTPGATAPTPPGPAFVQFID